MLPRNHSDRIRIAFDDHLLVANAGLLLPSTLAQHLGLPQLVDRRLDLGRAPDRANTGDKMMTLVASALAGGDCIDDADVEGIPALQGLVPQLADHLAGQPQVPPVGGRSTSGIRRHPPPTPGRPALPRCGERGGPGRCG